MKKFYTLMQKVEYEVPAFVIMAVQLPVEQMKVYGYFYYILCLAAALFLGRIIRLSGSRSKSFVLVFAALLLAGELTKTLFMPAYTVPFDIMLKAISLLCFFLSLAVLRRSNSGSHRSFFTWSVPVLCLAGTLAWPSFLFFYLPVVLIISAYENGKNDKYGLNFAFHAAWFLPLTVACAYAVFGFLTGKKLLGFIPFPYGFKILPLRDIGLALAALLPLIVVFILLWRLVLRGAADKKAKWLMAICMTEPAVVILLNLFMYYAVSDGWKYCIAAVFFSWFCMLFYFNSVHEQAVASAFEKMAGFLLRNPFILLATMVYLIKSIQIFYTV